MKHFTFDINNNNTSKNICFDDCTFCNKPNYSKILDSIIATNIIKSNKYLGDYFTTSKSETKCDFCPLFNCPLKKKAKSYLFDLHNGKKIILGKKYLYGDTIIIFYDDEIQIGTKTYSYNDFDDIAFLNAIEEPKKKIIIDIYINKTTSLF
jgi:hypothetical protein